MNKYYTAGIIIITAFALIIGISVTQQLQPTAHALIDPGQDHRTRAPIAISGDNVYVVWTTDKNTPNNNSEVMFRASTDSGAAFGDKINLSNTTALDSFNAEINSY